METQETAAATVATPEPPADLDWRAIAEWALSGDTGISSETIIHRITGLPYKYRHSGHPHDLDDFGRCYRLLERIPSLRPYLPMLRAEGPVWSVLVDAWDGIAAAYARYVTAAHEAHQRLGWMDHWENGQAVYDEGTRDALRAAVCTLQAALHAGNPAGERSVEQLEEGWAAYDEAMARKARGEPDPDDDPDDDDGDWDDDDDLDDED